MNLFLFCMLMLSFFLPENPKNEFENFKKEPDYIINPTEEQREYFEAYDQTMLNWGVDFEDLYIPTSHGTAHVIMTGATNSENLILFHGLSSSSTMWYPNAKELSNHFRLFAIDLIIEPGKSQQTKDFKNLKEVSDWYQEVISLLKLETYHLVGPSRGGWFAMDLTIRFPEKVKSTVLLSPVQTFIWIPPSAKLFKNMANFFYSGRKRVYRTMSTLSNDAEKIDDDFLRQYRLGKENDASRKFVTGMQPFSRKKLKFIKTPVYLLVGDDDMFNNKRSLKKAKKNIPLITAELIEKSGHFLSVDQVDTINHKLIAFIGKK